MQLTDEQIAQFQGLYKKHFGIELTKKEAMAQGLELIGLVKLVHRPIKRRDEKKLIELDKQNN